MNVTKQFIPTKPSFSPYQITISVQSQHDEHILKYLSGAQWSIPEILHPEDTESFKDTQVLLNNIYKAITK